MSKRIGMLLVAAVGTLAVGMALIPTRDTAPVARGTDATGTTPHRSVASSRVASDGIALRWPNIVVILADDLGYGDVACYAREKGKIPTPNVDRLAREGMRFIDAHSGSSVCTPTRYGLLTGRYAWRTRLQQGVISEVDGLPLIDEKRLTVGRLLQQNGYHTACIGKWHLGYQCERPSLEREPRAEAVSDNDPMVVAVGTRLVDGPRTRGFDEYFGFQQSRSIGSIVNNDHVALQSKPVDVLPLLTRKACDYVARRAAASRRGQPFFLYLPLSSPHTPIAPAETFVGRSGLGLYADFVMQTDAAVGELLDALDTHGLTESTLVLFASDNGCSPAARLEELEALGHFPSSGFRGYKSDIWEGGHRVPCIVRWPGNVAPGTVCEDLVCLNDLMATCADLLGVELPPDAAEDSVSLFPALRGESRSRLPRVIVNHSIDGMFAIRRGRWKLVAGPGSGGWSRGTDKDGPGQLYDLEDDPGETLNLYAREPELVAELESELQSIIANGRSTAGPPQSNDCEIVWRRHSKPGRDLSPISFNRD